MLDTQRQQPNIYGKKMRLWIYMVLMLQPVKNAALALGTHSFP